MWWRRFDIDAVNESQILRSLVVTTRRLFIWVVFFTSSIFSSLTDIDMSLIFFVDRLWLLGEMLSREWKLCMTTFLITQRSNIVWTASNWDLLTLLTSIRTQNRIKRFVVDITYRWISLSVCIKHNQHKLYELLKSFSTSNHAWKSIALNFIIKLSKSKERIMKTMYDSILIITDRLIKYEYFLSYKKVLRAYQGWTRLKL